MIECFNLIS